MLHNVRNQAPCCSTGVKKYSDLQFTLFFEEYDFFVISRVYTVSFQKNIDFGMVPNKLGGGFAILFELTMACRFKGSEGACVGVVISH